MKFLLDSVCVGFNPNPPTPTINMKVNDMNLDKFKLDIIPHYHDLYKIALNLAKHDQDKAKDIVQTTYVQAMIYASYYKKIEGKSIGAWLNTILKNVFLTDCRSNKQMKKKNIIYGDYSYFDGNDHSLYKKEGKYIEHKATGYKGVKFDGWYDSIKNPIDILITNELKEVVSNGICDLDEPFKSTLYKYYVQEKSVDDISKNEECTKNAVIVRLYNGRKKLKGKLESYIAG